MIREITDFAAYAMAVSWEEIVEATRRDAELQKILESIDQDKRHELPVEFRVFSNELCRVGDILLRGDRIVAPGALRNRILQIAHEGHLGTSMMKSALRSSVWWPKMDREVEDFVRNCRGCILVSAPDAPEPMTRKRMPAGPWQEIAVDFLGPLPEGQWLFVVVDYYSRFVEVVEMKSISAADTIRELATIFSRFGVPTTMRADNGPQLSKECRELSQFCEEFNIQLVNTIPYWPQANGEVERQNRSILKRLRIAQELGKDWRLELRKFLLAYHSTSHSATGRSPGELMFGRKMRNKLPSIPEYKEDEEVRDSDRIVKEKGKQYADNKRKARRNDIEEGDFVYVKRQRKDNKLSTEFSSEVFKVIRRTGLEVIVRSLSSGNEYKRCVSHLKKAENQAQATDHTSEDSGQNNLRSQEAKSDTEATESEKRRRVAPKKFQDYVPF
ncbi:hypothetical protein RP20_CCG008218 [Aedes albopictus]|nr:hypothetical protein RP20_CCG008218 [Aedes albopictus]